jgi:hypothetical protein
VVRSCIIQEPSLSLAFKLPTCSTKLGRLSAVSLAAWRLGQSQACSYRMNHTLKWILSSCNERCPYCRVWISSRETPVVKITESRQMSFEYCDIAKCAMAGAPCLKSNEGHVSECSPSRSIRLIKIKSAVWTADEAPHINVQSNRLTRTVATCSNLEPLWPSRRRNIPHRRRAHAHILCPSSFSRVMIIFLLL